MPEFGDDKIAKILPQCNEVSSSDTEDSPNPPPLPTRRRKPSGPPLMTRSRQVRLQLLSVDHSDSRTSPFQVEAAAPGPPQPPRKQPRVAPPLPPTTTATGYGSDSENHQPEVRPYEFYLQIRLSFLGCNSSYVESLQQSTTNASSLFRRSLRRRGRQGARACGSPTTRRRRPP